MVLWFGTGAVWTTMWIFGLGLEIAVRILAWTATAGWVALLIRGRRWPGALLVSAVAAGLTAVLLMETWIEVYPRAWFWVYRASFVEAETLARNGGLPGDLDEYYGSELPGSLGVISVTGNISTTGPVESTSCASQRILFVPAWVGIPDGAIGFVHFACEPPAGLALDGYGDDICPRIRLGDGWWWADGNGCDGSAY
jgi:hypothetical protein